MSIAGSKLLRLPYIPAIVATFAVDIADKTLKDTFHITPCGRCWFHTLLSVAILSAIVWYLKGKSWGLSWMTGHLLHLVGDMGFVPWFYPFIHYDWPAPRNMVAVSASFLKELLWGLVSGHGWEFSDSVRQVFQPHLFFIEGMMLVSILFYCYGTERKRFPKPVTIGLLVVFFLFTTVGILIQFPYFESFIAMKAGN